MRLGCRVSVCKKVKQSLTRSRGRLSSEKQEDNLLSKIVFTL